MRSLAGYTLFVNAPFASSVQLEVNNVSLRRVLLMVDGFIDSSQPGG